MVWCIFHTRPPIRRPSQLMYRAVISTSNPHSAQFRDGLWSWIIFVSVLTPLQMWWIGHYRSVGRARLREKFATRRSEQAALYLRSLVKVVMLQILIALEMVTVIVALI